MHIPKERRNKLDNKSEKCIFIGCKDEIKGHKLWNLDTRSVVYSRYFIFREDESFSKNEEAKREKEPKNLEFNLRNESHDLDGLTESEEEVDVQTLVVRIFVRARKQLERYSPPKFLSAFALSSIEYDLIIVKEVIISIECDLWKREMEEEMKSCEKE